MFESIEKDQSTIGGTMTFEGKSVCSAFKTPPIVPEVLLVRIDEFSCVELTVLVHS